MRARQSWGQCRGLGGTHRIRPGTRRSQSGCQSQLTPACSAAASKSIAFLGVGGLVSRVGTVARRKQPSLFLADLSWVCSMGVARAGVRSGLTILRASHSPPLPLPGAEPAPAAVLRVWGPGTRGARPGGLSRGHSSGLMAVVPSSTFREAASCSQAELFPTPVCPQGLGADPVPSWLWMSCQPLGKVCLSVCPQLAEWVSWPAETPSSWAANKISCIKLEPLLGQSPGVGSVPEPEEQPERNCPSGGSGASPRPGSWLSGRLAVAWPLGVLPAQHSSLLLPGVLESRWRLPHSPGASDV